MDAEGHTLLQRCLRLLPLLESQTDFVRHRGRQQLGTSVRSHLDELDGNSAVKILSPVAVVLKRLLVLCTKSKQWETRVSASQSLADILKALTESLSTLESSFLQICDSLPLLSLTAVDLSNVFEKASMLLSKPKEEFLARLSNDGRQTNLLQERAETLKNLRSNSFRPFTQFARNITTKQELQEDQHANAVSVQDHSFLINEEDIGDSKSNPHISSGLESSLKTAMASEDSKTGIHNLLIEAQTGGKKRLPEMSIECVSKRTKGPRPSAREAAQAKLANLSSKEDLCSEKDDVTDHINLTIPIEPQSINELFASAWYILLQMILSNCWEARHGAATTILTILTLWMNEFSSWKKDLKVHFHKIVEDVALRNMCVIGMDRFGDYADDNVVAPVREVCAQILGVAFLCAPESNIVPSVLGMLTEVPNLPEMGDLDLSHSTIWGRRYGALLALKYILVSALKENRRVEEEVVPVVANVLLCESESHMLKTRAKIRDTPSFNDEIRFAAGELLLVAMFAGKSIDLSSVDFKQVDRIFSLAFAVAHEDTKAKENVVSRLCRLSRCLDDVTFVSSATVLQLTCVCLLHSRPSIDLFEVFRGKFSHPSHLVRSKTVKSLSILLQGIQKERKALSSGDKTNRVELVKPLEAYFSCSLPAWISALLELYFRHANDFIQANIIAGESGVSQDALTMEQKNLDEVKETMQCFFMCFRGLDSRTACELFDSCLNFYDSQDGSISRQAHSTWYEGSRRNATAFVIKCLLLSNTTSVTEIFIQRLLESESQNSREFIPLCEAGCIFLCEGTVIGGGGIQIAAVLEKLREKDNQRGSVFGPRSDTWVQNARVALFSSCKFLANSFVLAGLESNKWRCQSPLVQRFCESSADFNLNSVSNQELVEAAQILVAELVPTWVHSLSPPESREQAKRWNETTNSARQNVLDQVKHLHAVEARGRVERSALLCASKVFVMRHLSNSKFCGQVGPIIQPLLDSFKKRFEPPFDDHIVELLSKACSDLLVLLESGGESRQKALKKLGKKLVHMEHNSSNVKVFSVLSQRCKQEGLVKNIWKFLPDFRIELEEFISRWPSGVLGSLDHTKIRAWARCLRPLVQEGVFLVEADFLVKLVRTFCCWFVESDEMNAKLEESGKVREEIINLLSDCLSSTKNVRPIIWEMIHESFLPDDFGLNPVTHQSSNQFEENPAKSEGKTIRILNILKAAVGFRSSIPFAPSLIFPFLKGMQSGKSVNIRRLSGECFANVVELTHLVSNDQSSSLEGQLNVLTKRTEEGRDLVRALQVGATELVKADPFGSLRAANENGIKLRDYQREGVVWLGFLAKYGLSGALCDDLGLGKTLMALTQLASIAAPKLAYSLVVCPSSLTGHWREEINRWYPNKLLPVEYVGDPRSRKLKLHQVLAKQDGHFVLVVSYSVLSRDLQEFLGKFIFQYVILDEAHSIRNPFTAISAACKSIAMQTKHKLALTGTPIHNDAVDLWSIFDFLIPGYLGEHEWFEANIAKPIRSAKGQFGLEREDVVQDRVEHSQNNEEGGESVKNNVSEEEKERSRLVAKGKKNLAYQIAMQALESLHRRILPFLLQRRKEKVLQDLPPKIVQDIVVGLTPQQQTLYNFLLEELKGSVDSLLTASNEGLPSGQLHVFSELSRLLMACTHPLLCLRMMMQHAKSRVERRIVEKQISALKDAGFSASCKFRAIENLLHDHVLLQRNLATGDKRLARLTDAVESTYVPSNTKNSQTHKALIFAQWKGSLDLLEEQLLKQRFQGALRYLRLDGDVKPHDRQAVVNAFNTDSTISLLLATTKVGGQGLNLTAADIVIFLESSWNPQEDIQAMDRAHRIGQNRSVHVFRILSQSTIEEKVLKLQRFKLHIASNIIDASNSSLESMQTNTILDALSDDLGQTHSSEEAKEKLASCIHEVGELWGSEEYSTFNVTSFAGNLNVGNVGSPSKG